MTRASAAGAVLVLVLASAAGADVAFNNFGPGDTFTGNGWIIDGPQVSPSFTQAFRFVPTVSGQVTTVTLAMQHLQGANSFTFDVRADSGGQPGTVVGVLGSTAGFDSGSAPVQFAASPGVVLAAATTYWIYGQGSADGQGTWRTSPDLGGIRAVSFDGGATWSVAVIDPPGSIVAFRIEVQNAGGCYANCDGSTAAPVLTVADFTCFLQKFAAGDPYANCDGSTAAPVLNVADFTCFLQKFAAGCP
jgi:hypothetical protein